MAGERDAKVNRILRNGFSDRHRGGGHPPTPATPPCVRVRTRRFELVAPIPIDQRRKPKRFEVSIGKPHREGFGPSEIPRAASAASRVASKSRTDSQCSMTRTAQHSATAVGEKSRSLTMSAMSSHSLSTQLHALVEERHFALVDGLRFPTWAR